MGILIKLNEVIDSSKIKAIVILCQAIAFTPKTRTSWIDNKRLLRQIASTENKSHLTLTGILNTLAL